MSETAEVTVTETPVAVTITGNTPNITIDDSTPQITIYDHSTTITTTISAVPEVTIEADTNITLTADEQPTVVVNTGAGTPYDESTLLAMLADKLTFSQLDSILQNDITQNRDMWSRIGNELVLLYADGVDIVASNKTYTDTEISSSVADIHVTIDGEVDAKIATVVQTATELASTVTDLQVDVDGNFALQQSQIVQNANSITSTVLELADVDGVVTQHTSQIAQNSGSISLVVSDVTDLNGVVSEYHAEIVLNATNIGLQVSQISDISGRMDTAEVNITANAITNTVLSTAVGDQSYALEAVQTLLANSWSVNMSEDVGGNSYSTGFQLMLHPIWLDEEVYVIDDTVFFTDDKVYICILGHTASTTNNPGGASGSTYWTEVVGGVKSEFVVEAEKFQVSIPTESAPVPVFTVTGSTVRVNGTLLTDSLEALTAYIELSIQSTNYEEGVIGWQLDKAGNFSIYGGTAVFGSGVLPALPSDDGLVGYWSMDENAGTTVKDASIYENDGVFAGTPTWVPGVSGSGINFPVGGGALSCGTDASLRMVGDQTFVCWYTPQWTLPNPVGHWYLSINLSWLAYGAMWIIAGSTGIPSFYTCQSGTSSFAAADTALTPGTKYIIGVVIKDGMATMYLDGVPDSTPSAIDPPTVSASAFMIGYNSANQSPYGMMDEFRAYNKALTANEMLALAMNPGGNKAPYPGATKGAPDWEHASDTTKINGGDIYAGSSITIGEVGVGDYCVIDSGDISFYQWLDSEARFTKGLKRIEAGSAANNTVQALPGYWKEAPQIIVSLKEIQSYEESESARNQNIRVAATAPVLQSGEIAKYEFTPTAELVLDDYSYNGAPGYTDDDTEVDPDTDFTATTAAKTLIANVKQIEVDIKAKGFWLEWTGPDAKGDYTVSRYPITLDVRVEWKIGSTWYEGTYSDNKDSSNSEKNWTLSTDLETSDITDVRVTVRHLGSWSHETPAYLVAGGYASPASDSCYIWVEFDAFTADVGGDSQISEGTLNWIAIGY